MPPIKICPKCCCRATYKPIISPVVFGYVCSNCGYEFGHVTIKIGWGDAKE